jgi:hypothetical protein
MCVERKEMPCIGAVGVRERELLVTHARARKNKK